MYISLNSLLKYIISSIITIIVSIIILTIIMDSISSISSIYNIYINLWCKNIFLTVILTFLLLSIPNKSNFSPYIIIPIITSLISKYSIGDLDKGYQYTISDVFYWISLYLSSASCIWIYHTYLTYSTSKRISKKTNSNNT